MAHPSATGPDAVIEHDRLDSPVDPGSRISPQEFLHGAMLEHVPGIGETGLVATKDFAENDTILCAPAGICRTRGILARQLRGLCDFQDSPQHRIDAVHAIAATMQQYEQGSSWRRSLRPFNPCMSITYVMSLLADSPSPDVKRLIDELRDTSSTDAVNSFDLSDMAGLDNYPKDPGWDQSSEASALRVLRFLDGAFVAEDVGEHHLVYTHFTAYVSYHPWGTLRAVAESGCQVWLPWSSIFYCIRIAEQY